VTTIPALRDVECPSCHHRQTEVVSVVGTICRGCRESFTLPRQPGLGRGAECLEVLQACGGRALESLSSWTKRWRKKPSTPRLTRVAPPVRLTAGEAVGRSALEAADQREVTCPHCQLPAVVPGAALSHCCLECGSYFPLGDYEISGVSQANLATAGTVSIHHGARLDAAWVRCGELVVYGQATGALTVTGTAEFHGEGDSVGELHCGHLIVASGARRIFHQRIFALSADINGEISGDVCCAGRLQVARGGAIHGAVLAGQVAIAPGGRINGSMATRSAVRPAGARLNQTARELLENFGQDEAVA
jgi:cytoskeletal protein CcmA (bactofilin family)